MTEFAAMFIGFRYFLFLRKKQGDNLESQNRLIVLVGAIFGSLIGSRVVGGLENIEQLRTTDNLLLYFFSNKSIAGGLVGGLFGVECIKLLIREKKKSGDLFVFPLILALLIGRIGCFSMGIHEQTYGVVTHCMTGMNLGDGLRRHPVMLYEIAFLSVLWIILYRIHQTIKLKSGTLFQYFMISYLVFRFFIEMLKPTVPYFLQLGTIQIACCIGLLYYLIRYLIQRFLILYKN